ncbi:calcium/sodium antiporter [Fodinibius sp.]|uniref:calcium/sodium antiporter n=1 Tax=Fodinibius sp. TaxID=1872440 RepID=UPI002ACEBC42|nr:calcium/sodium antiporter [Fodinibius sp.]MDZ7659838.1 calcium/sodium antiporter [Fodinibius sp.]
MITTILFFVAGLLSLIGGAELLVRGASALAGRLGMTPLVIGLTVVAFGTSAPELAISLQSGIAGEDALLLGNVIGSNIFNVLFILGISAILAPLIISKNLIKLDVPLMIGASILLYFFAWNGAISPVEGGILFISLLTYIGFLIYDARKQHNAQLKDENTQTDASKSRYWLWDVGFVFAGFVLLVIGARWLVNGAVTFAEYLGVSSLVIGLTIVAAGTSLPEIATSILASIKGERDLAVGNIVGSNLFNIMCIIGLTAIVLPGGIAVQPGVVGFDIPVMIAASLVCLPIFITGSLISRWEGIFFLGYYIAFTVYLVLTATEHHLLPYFNAAMGWFVLPMTLITGLFMLVREWKNGTKVS